MNPRSCISQQIKKYFWGFDRRHCGVIYTVLCFGIYQRDGR